MSRTVQITVYPYPELDAKAKSVARLWAQGCLADDDWYTYIKEDAQTVGVNIVEFDLHHWFVKVKLTLSIEDSIKAVLANHGETCETYKIALKYQTALATFNSLQHTGAEEESGLENLTIEYQTLMGREYLKLLQKEDEHRNSDEYIEEFLTANDYEFYGNGRLFKD